MKNFLLTITGFILSVNAFAQNWQTFNSKAQYIFKNAQYDSFVVYDSVKVNNNDTLLYNFKTIRQVVTQNMSAVFSAVASTWIGKVVVVKPNGTNVFLTGDNDSVYIETRAKLCTVFTIYDNISKNLHVNGRVDSIVSGKVLGINDSLKYITVIRNGSIGYGLKTDSVTSIILSKNHGLFQTVTFLNIGYKYPDAADYRNKTILKGHSQISDTYKNLQVADIYDFNVGDELHTHSGVLYNEADEKKIEKILSRAYSINGDTLIYNSDICKTDTIYSGGQKSQFHGIVTLKYAINDPADPINFIPGKTYFNVVNRSANMSFQLGDTVIATNFNSLYYCGNTSDSCVYGFYEGPVYNNYYYKGLGGNYYKYGFYVYNYYNDLVYFKKGAVETGIPYDCDILLPVIDPLFQIQKTKVYPNPAKDRLTIEVNQVSSVSMKDIVGLEVYKGQLGARSNEINISQLLSGIYFVVISTGDTTITEKIVVE